jgi:Malectin domain
MNANTISFMSLNRKISAKRATPATVLLFLVLLVVIVNAVTTIDTATVTTSNNVTSTNDDNNKDFTQQHQIQHQNKILRKRRRSTGIVSPNTKGTRAVLATSSGLSALLSVTKSPPTTKTTITTTSALTKSSSLNTALSTLTGPAPRRGLLFPQSVPSVIQGVLFPTKSPPIVAPTTTALTSDGLQLDDLPIRINAGFTSGDWIDPKTKLKWKLDNSYDSKSSTQGIVENFCGGTEAIWCSYRQGMIVTYKIRVLDARERYKITLFVDEPMFSVPNARLFDVYVEGVLVRSKVDPFVLSGGKNKMANITIALNDRVMDGYLNIMLKANGIQKALVNGILIEISPFRQFVDFPLRINSGASVTWTDPRTKWEWLPDTDYDKLTLPVNDCAKIPNPSLPTDQLYCSYRMGSIINYAIRVLDFVARYRVTFYMQEPSFVGIGKRNMDIFIENKLISPPGGFDIVKFAGAKNKPTSFAIITDKIMDGIIDIRLKSASGKNSTGQKVIISGLLVERT